MFKTRYLFVTLIVALTVAACGPWTATATPTPPPTMTENPPTTGMATVQSVDIQLVENSPLQVNAIVRGQLPDGGCTKISGVHQSRDGYSIKVTLTTVTDAAAVCVLVLTPFEYLVTLDVAGLSPGEYIVDVNGVQKSFELLTRDVSKFKPLLVEALNARNYDLLKLMMGDSFTIGYWLSEGTTHTPDSAIEQLKTNLLNSNSPITADYSRNLVELLGTDPRTIVDPQLVDVSALFISGLGAQGRDEALLFAAKLPDGSLFWHGLLFAKDGFARPEPVDMNAYATEVKYVMALRDVRMRSGPGTQFSTISYIAAGQTAKVTGVSAGGSWWRVICPDNSIGSCWVSAAPHLTRPTDGPLPDTTVYPTDVQYVMANRDVTMYSGPGTQFNVVGYIAAGQIAKVTGVSVNGSWWRVICPDNSIGSCWVSANSEFTRPTDLSRNADVQSVQIQILESQPLQVNAIARGQLPDGGCTTISSVSQTRSGNIFYVTLKTQTDPSASCAQVLTPFEYVIALEVGSLPPATYIVNVNGVEASFELPASVFPADVQSVEIQILESYPLQVNAIARGQMPDAGCTTIYSVNQTRSGNTFNVTLKAITDPWAFCAQTLTPFEQVIALEVGSLLPATYIVNVNGVEKSFELPEAVFPTDVKYVMAQVDAPMYSGPGTQYNLISSIAAGQTAKVTGVNASGSWWRVICPDDKVGSCWVSANPAHTQPAQPPG